MALRKLALLHASLGFLNADENIFSKNRKRKIGKYIFTVMIDALKIKKQFPIFSHHPNLAYLDNAATTQKPQIVIDGITDFYQKENANIHRGIYDLAAKTSQKYEAVRNKVAQFLNAPCLLYTSPSPRDRTRSRMPSSA